MSAYPEPAVRPPGSSRVRQHMVQRIRSSTRPRPAEWCNSVRVMLCGSDHAVISSDVATFSSPVGVARSVDARVKPRRPGWRPHQRRRSARSPHPPAGSTPTRGAVPGPHSQSVAAGDSLPVWLCTPVRAICPARSLDLLGRRNRR